MEVDSFRVLGVDSEQPSLNGVDSLYRSGSTLPHLHDRLLNGDKSDIHLDLRRRLKITLDISSGVAYLHGLVDPPIIHRDVKSNNILLDDCLNAMVVDFGPCKPMYDGIQDHVTTQVKGTVGYMDHEYYMTQQRTEKCDVYSFEVLLLELVTARRLIEKGNML
ncbi:hypothetical protein Taro_054222 [Colocasia esculenta]|uniref:Protein kinase domain-containing protein n=1 Tax=Colocasia esculenta TaxID=4460 RepID=A0A843XQJ7_COLES|nr:hypothetical protein [Colocasia esculenta]